MAPAWPEYLTRSIVNFPWAFVLSGIIELDLNKLNGPQDEERMEVGLQSASVNVATMAVMGKVTRAGEMGR